MVHGRPQKWYYYLKSVKGRSVGAHVPRSRPCAWRIWEQVISYGSAAERLEGRVPDEKSRHWRQSWALEDGGSLRQNHVSDISILGWVGGCHPPRKRGECGREGPPHSMPRSGFWVCPRVLSAFGGMRGHCGWCGDSPLGRGRWTDYPPPGLACHIGQSEGLEQERGNQGWCTNVCDHTNLQGQGPPCLGGSCSETRVPYRCWQNTQGEPGLE